MYNWNAHTRLTNYIFRGWRKPRFLAIAKAFVEPLVLIGSDFQVFRLHWTRKLQGRFQLIYLEKYLNEEYLLSYDLATRDADIAATSIIYIENAQFLPRRKMFDIEEQKPSYKMGAKTESYSLPMYGRADYAVAVHYTVKVPASLQYNEKVMRAQIDFYNQAGKQYNIETY